MDQATLKRSQTTPALVKKPDEVTARRKNSEKSESGEKCDVKRFGNNTEQNYSGKRRDALAISSIKGLAAEAYCHHDDEGYEKEAKNVGEARASHYQLHNSHKGKEPGNNEGNDEVSKKFALNLEHQKSFSSRISVYPLNFIEVGNTRQITDQIQESSGRIENSIKNTEKFRKVLKTAWVVGEEHCHEQKQKHEPELKQEQNQNQKQGQELEMEEAVTESQPDATERGSSRSATVSRDESTTRSGNKRQEQRQEPEPEQEQRQSQTQGQELEMEEAVIESGTRIER